MWRVAVRVRRQQLLRIASSQIQRFGDEIQTQKIITGQDRFLHTCKETFCTQSLLKVTDAALSFLPDSQELMNISRQCMEIIEGAEFLRVPEWLCLEWGYADYRHEPLLLNRDCYKVLTSRIVSLLNDDARSVTILGSSGLGKSGFCVYMLWWLLTREDYNWSLLVLKFFDGSDVYTMFSKDKAGSLSCTQVSDPAVVKAKVWEMKGKGNVVYLADGQVPHIHWALPCKFILTCSPAKANHWHFRKIQISRVLYVPAWSEAEIVALNKAVFKRSEAEVRAAFEKWGGVPRYVLADRRSDALLYSAISFVGRQLAISPATSVVGETPDTEANHRVFHYDVDEGTCDLRNERCPMKFGSRFIAQKVANAVPPSLIDKIAGGAASDKMKAAIFDTFFHRLVERGFTTDSRKMDEQGKWEQVVSDALPLVRFEYVPKVDGNDAILPEKLPPWVLDCTMIRPSSSSNRAWDLIIGRRIFQAAVTTRRDTKKLEVTNGLVDAANFLRRCYGDNVELEFVYFVPSALFDYFSPSFPGGKDRAGKAACVQHFTRTLRVKVKKMCFRSDSLSDVEALTSCERLQLGYTSWNCKLASVNESNSFEDMEFRPGLRDIVKNMGFKAPNNVQQKVIPPFIGGENVLAHAPRDSGCTAALSIAAVQQVELCKGLHQLIVLAPNEKAVDGIFMQMRSLNDAQVQIEKTVGKEEWHVLVGTPSEVYSVCKDLTEEQLQSISTVVMDEADEILKEVGLEDVQLCVDLPHKMPQLAVVAHSMPPALMDFVCRQVESVSCS